MIIEIKKIQALLLLQSDMPDKQFYYLVKKIKVKLIAGQDQSVTIKNNVTTHTANEASW